MIISANAKERQDIYKKLCEYRLDMANMLRNLLIYEKKDLIENYSVWYQNYKKLKNKIHQQTI
jgi:hypothetical protein